MKLKGYKKKKPVSGGIIQTSSGTVFPYSLALVKQHTHVDKYGEVYKNYKVIGKNTDNQKIMLPRALHPVAGKDNRVFGDEVDYTFIGKPRNEEQERVCAESLHEIQKGNKGFLVSASTGFGKTFIGCYIISQVKVPCLILITKSDLKTQWFKSIQDFLGIPKNEIGLIKGDTCKVAGCKVVVGFVQSLMKDDRYPSWIYKQFGLVISDEVHLMGADKFVNAMFLLPAAWRVGLSATLDRPDNKSHVFKDHIGSKVIRAELLPMQFYVIKVLTGIKAPPHVSYRAGRTMALSNYLGGLQPRQQLITNKIINCLDKGRNIVCFADTLEHLDSAYTSLINSGVRNSKIGFYVGGRDEDDLKKQAHKRVVLTTYKMCQYGTDFPHWDTAMLMTPRSDVTQIVGRILRESEGKKDPVVFDFVDNIKLLRSYWGSRLSWYARKALKVIN